MRTLQEKYNAVLEGKFSKTQFRRDAAMELPQFISNVNSFDDTVAILKNKGIVTEAKKNERYFESDPADHISPDVLDTGIKCELEKKFNTTDVTPEQYEKAKEAAVKNLTKDRAYYAKESGEQLDTPAEQMEKAKLNEETDALFARNLKAAGHDYEKMMYDLGDAVAAGEGLEDASAEELKVYAQIALRLGDDTDVVNAFEYLENLPNYRPEFTPDNLRKANEAVSKEEAWKKFQEDNNVTDKTAKVAREDFEKEWEAGNLNETVDTDDLRAKIANILKGQLSSLNKMGGDAIIEDYLETQIQAYLDGDVDVEEPMEVVNDFRYYMDANQSAAHDFNKSLSPDDTTPESPKKDDDVDQLEESEVVDLPMTAAGYSRGETYTIDGIGTVRIIDQLDGDDIPAAYGRFKVQKLREDQDYTLTPDEREEKEKEKFDSYYTGEGREALKEMFKKIIVNLINE